MDQKITENAGQLRASVRVVLSYNPEHDSNNTKRTAEFNQAVADIKNITGDDLSDPKVLAEFKEVARSVSEKLFIESLNKRRKNLVIGEMQEGVERTR